MVVRAGQLFTQLCLQGSIIFIPLLGSLIAQGWGYRGVMFFAAALGVAGMMATVPAGGKRRTGDGLNGN
ncbi:MAG: hypothetical protein A4E56_02487 [Pelotomaculum sp. PtaU1.Bin065]|nr:MAG: hypothetical protein A4E56_02487 [Pelotomaculum sp. PtaU1.Bin065]